MEDFRTKKLIKFYRKTKSKVAYNVLIKNHINSIYFVIHNYFNSNLDFLSIGYSVLIDSINRFDLRRKIKFNTYFINILKFRIIDEIRKQYSTKPITVNPKSSINPFNYVENQQLKETLIESITKLPKEQQIIIAYIYEGGTQKELAKQTGFSPAYINQIYQKGLKRLKKLLI